LIRASELVHPIFRVLSLRAKVRLLFGDTCFRRCTSVPGKKKPPKAGPPLNTVVRLIAALGGFLGRKGDPGLAAQFTRDVV